MSINLKIVNAADGSVISAEVEPTDPVSDILLFATQYWDKQNYAFVMKVGNRLVRSNISVEEAGLSDGDAVTIVPDPQGG